MSNLMESLHSLPSTETSFESRVKSVALAVRDIEESPCNVVHRFGAGIYMREVHMKAGTFAIGHSQKKEHMNILLKGSCTIYKEDGTEEYLTAPMVFTYPAGRKVGTIHEDMVWINVYPTEETDVEKLEEMYLDKSAEDWRGTIKENPLIIQDEVFIQESREDYLDVIGLLGYSVEEVKAISEDEEDQIPFPAGSYVIEVASSKIEGKGLFATSNIEIGTLIAPARVQGKRTPAGRYTNHGVIANAEMQMSPNGDVYLVATKPIIGKHGGLRGEEILVDYYKTYTSTREDSCQAYSQH